jgi:predicted RNase H-like nuclease (RuvC/YqgF family)
MDQLALSLAYCCKTYQAMKRKLQKIAKNCKEIAKLCFFSAENF